MFLKKYNTGFFKNNVSADSYFISSCSLNFSLILISAFCSAVMLALMRLLGFFLTRLTLAFFLPGSMMSWRLRYPVNTGLCKMSFLIYKKDLICQCCTMTLKALTFSVVESFMGSLPFNFVSQHFRGRLFMLSNIGFNVFTVQQHPIKKLFLQFIVEILIARLSPIKK